MSMYRIWKERPLFEKGRSEHKTNYARNHRLSALHRFADQTSRWNAVAGCNAFVGMHLRATRRQQSNEAGEAPKVRIETLDRSDPPTRPIHRGERPSIFRQFNVVAVFCFGEIIEIPKD